MRNFFILFFITFLVETHARSGSANFEFNYLGVENGLSNNHTIRVLKDSRGFIWIATISGLNKFDGNDMTTYLSNPDDTLSLSSSYINDLAEDSDGNIWVATEFGLNRFNRKTETFTRFVSDNKTGLLNNYIIRILYDKRSYLWVISGTGILTRMNLNTGNINFFKLNKFSNTKDAPDLKSMVLDQNGNLYVFSENGDLYKVSNNLVTCELKLGAADILHTSFNPIFLNSPNELWIGYGSGIFIYNLKTKALSKLLMPDTKSAFCYDANDIKKDTRNNIWISTMEYGILVLHAANPNQVSHFKYNDRDARSICSNSTGLLYADNSGSIWITSADGLSYYYPETFKFESFQYKSYDASSLSHPTVNTIYQTSNGLVWVGTNNGLNLFNYSNGQSTRFFLDKAVNINNKTSSILNLFEDASRQLWVTTFSGQIYASPVNQTRFRPLNIIDNFKGEKPRCVNSITQDADGTLWFGTIGTGLFYLKSNTIAPFGDLCNQKLSSNYITTLLTDNSGIIWIGAEYGLNRYNKKTNKLSSFNSDNGFGAIASHVNCIFQDSKNHIWIGTNQGLFLYLPFENSFKAYTTKDRLPYSSVMSVLEDEKGRLWIASGKYICCIEFITADYSKFNLLVYDNNDGLQGKEFRRSAACLTSNGNMIFGGNNGLNIFNPQLISEDQSRVQVVITKLKIFNNEIKPNSLVNGKTIINESIGEIKSLQLSYKENMFSIGFTALSYVNPKKYQYRYKLEGFDKNWINTGPDMRLATYTNLDAGEYTFRVTAFTSDGAKAKNDCTLQIIITPPFWRTPFARVMFVLIFLIISLLLRYIIRSNERSKMKLRIERKEAERQHELDSMKLKFFTNISHEFRTPLTLLISPLEKMMSENKLPEQHKMLDIMHRNAKRLLNLINQLLDFRKLEAYGLTFSPSMGEIVQFIKNIATSFTDVAERRNIAFNFKTNIESLNMQFDADKLEKTIYNLLSNAFKYTETGSVTLAINYFSEVSISIPDAKSNNAGSMLEIQVNDTGIGIPRNMVASIFDRFVQANQNSKVLNQGTGIGLSLVQEYVNMHKGSITVESVEGNGSRFTILLPVHQSAVIESAQAETKTLFEVQSVQMPAQHANDDKLPDSKLSLLIVEDSDDLRLYLKDNLQHKYRIIEADNGLTGQQYAFEYLPDLIISDIMMPRMNGIELCKSLKNNAITSHIPLILLTARYSEEQQIEGISSGADDYLTKPFNFKILEAKVKNLISIRKKNAQTLKNTAEIKPSELQITSLDEQFFTSAIKKVEENIGNADFSVEAFSREMGVSRMLLYKKLIAITGKSPIEFIRIMRLKRAAQLLQTSQLTVSEIAYKVGFNNAKYLSKYFKDEFGLLPTEYIAKHKNDIKRIV